MGSGLMGEKRAENYGYIKQEAAATAHTHALFVELAWATPKSAMPSNSRWEGASHFIRKPLKCR